MRDGASKAVDVLEVHEQGVHLGFVEYPNHIRRQCIKLANRVDVVEVHEEGVDLGVAEYLRHIE